MSTRILMAALLGGIAMFIWTSIAHLALPLGEAGVKEIPNEGNVIMALDASLGKTDGFYLYPGTGLSADATREQKNEAMKMMATKVENGPSGLIVYHPRRPFTFGRWMIIELVTQLVETLLALCLLAQTNIVSYFGRVAFITVLGIVAAVATNISYWNWYGFPGNYTASYMTIEIVGFLCAGLVAALILPKKVLLRSA